MFAARSAGVARSALFLLVAGFSLRAQLLQPKEPMPSFEVATIRPWSPSTVIPPVGAGRPQKVMKEAPVGAAAPVGDRVQFIGQIELLIEAAYGLPFSSNNRILGGPEWIRSESDRYEVIAKIDDAHYAAIQKMSLRTAAGTGLLDGAISACGSLQIQSAHRDQGDAKVCSDRREGWKQIGAGSRRCEEPIVVRPKWTENELKATAVSVEELARSPFLRIDKRQIVDKTGLQGRFSFTLKFRNADVGGNEADSNAPELPTALQEQLGLRLAPENGPVEVVVIDHIERPSEN